MHYDYLAIDFLGNPTGPQIKIIRRIKGGINKIIRRNPDLFVF
jgi:hypothetical protein